jgi:hypothetical protein
MYPPPVRIHDDGHYNNSGSVHEDDGSIKNYIVGPIHDDGERFRFILQYGVDRSLGGLDCSERGTRTGNMLAVCCVFSVVCICCLLSALCCTYAVWCSNTYTRTRLIQKHVLVYRHTRHSLTLTHKHTHTHTHTHTYKHIHTHTHTHTQKPDFGARWASLLGCGYSAGYTYIYV